MKPTPVDSKIVDEIKNASQIDNMGKASIREIVRTVNQIEERTGVKFIRMEMGVPGLPPSQVGTDAEIEALRMGVASKYPMIDGHPPLKHEVSRFVKLFLDIEVSPDSCIPTVGSMMGSMAAFMVANRTDHTKEGTLFIDPGFPVQKQQCLVLGHDYKSFDVYDYRGDKLKEKLDVDFRKYRILGACNPALAYKALEKEDKIGTMLPCNVIVQQLEEDKVEVAAVDPIASMQAIENPELSETASTVKEKLERVIEGL